MPLDSIKGKLLQIQQSKQTESVKVYLTVLKELIDMELMASFNLKGEDASCALAKIQGMSVALNLEEIFDKTLGMHSSSQIIKPGR